MAQVLPRLKAMQASVEPGGKLHHLAVKGKQAAAAMEQGETPPGAAPGQDPP